MANVFSFETQRAAGNICSAQYIKVICKYKIGDCRSKDAWNAMCIVMKWKGYVVTNDSNGNIYDISYSYTDALIIHKYLMSVLK